MLLRYFDYRRTNIPIEIEKRNQDKFMHAMMEQIKMLAEGEKPSPLLSTKGLFRIKS